MHSGIFEQKNLVYFCALTMSIDERISIFLIFFANFASCEKWIKLPDIRPDVKIKQIKKPEIPQMVVFKLAPPPAIMTSDVIHSVFSTNPTTTSESPIITADYFSSTKRSYTKKYLQSTVTSKVITFPSNVSELIDDEEFDPIPVVMVKPMKNQKVKFFNQTMSMNVLPIITTALNDSIDRFDVDKSEESEEEEDDGVTITDDINDSLEYYEDYEESATSTSSTTTTTSTQSPKREHKISAKNNPQRQKKPQRRIIAVRANPNLSFSSFIKFIKTIQESLAIKTSKTITEKIKMLMEFRDSLMMAINRQIRRLWKMQPKVTTTTTARGNKRFKRTLGDGIMEKGGAMDFPSSEGALLSICFLTFAVFLIKLVLQVIHTIKMKKAMLAAQMMNNVDTTVIKRHRSGKRDLDEKYRNIAKILDSIENLKV